jgi:hypothetical protein
MEYCSPGRFMRTSIPLRNHLEPHRIANGDDINDGLAVLIGLEFHVALVFIACHGMKHDCSILDRLAVEVFGDGHFNTAGWGRSLVFAAALGGCILTVCQKRNSQKAESGHDGN